MINKTNKNAQRRRRHLRVRKNIFGTKACPRLNIYRSTSHIYAQVINDENGTTLCSASTLSKELAETLNERYKGKLLYEHIGAYYCFGYPKFEGDVDRINMYLKPYYTYYEDSRKIESRLKDYNYTTIREDEIETRIQPITFDEMKEIVKTFKGVDVEYVMKRFEK